MAAVVQAAPGLRGVRDRRRPLVDPATRPAPRPGRVAPAVLRRRRAAAALLAGGLAWLLWSAAGWLGGGPLTASGHGPAVLELQPVAASSVVVQPGDTLWAIARRLQPEGDVRPLVHLLSEARGERALQIGERIDVGAAVGVTRIGR